MPMENPHETNKRFAETLKKLGLVSLILIDEKAGKGDMVWTKDGQIFRTQLVHLYQELAKDKGHAGMTEFFDLLMRIVQVSGKS
jgi:hypothetical protein